MYQPSGCFRYRRQRVASTSVTSPVRIFEPDALFRIFCDIEKQANIPEMIKRVLHQDHGSGAAQADITNLATTRKTCLTSDRQLRIDSSVRTRLPGTCRRDLKVSIIVRQSSVTSSTSRCENHGRQVSMSGHRWFSKMGTCSARVNIIQIANYFNILQT